MIRFSRVNLTYYLSRVCWYNSCVSVYYLFIYLYMNHEDWSSHEDEKKKKNK